MINNKMLSVRVVFLTFLLRLVTVYAGDTDNSLWNTFRYIVKPRNSISGNVNSNNNVQFFQSTSSERRMSSDPPVINSPQHNLKYNFYKKYNYSKFYIPPERTVLSSVVLDNTSKPSYNKFNSNHNYNNSTYFLNSQTNLNTGTQNSSQSFAASLVRKNTRRPFSSTELYPSNDIKLQNTYNNSVTTPSSKSSIISLPSVRRDDDDDDEEEDEEEADDEEEEDEEEDDEDDGGFESSLVTEEEDDDDEEDENNTSEVDGKEEEKEEDDNYDESSGTPSRKKDKKKHGGKKKKKGKKGKKKKKGQFKIKHFKKLKKYMLPLLLAYKLKFFTLIPLLLGGLVLIVGTTGFAGFFFALFAIGLSLQKH